MSLQWNHKTEGRARKTYTVTWSSATNNGRKTGITGTSTNITKLKSNTAYKFTLIAVNSGGGSSPSDPLHVITGMKVCKARLTKRISF